MTPEEIQNKAEEAAWNWAVKNKLDPYSMGRAFGEGYIKALTEIESLPKIHGWVVRDEDRRLFVGVSKPKRIGECSGFGTWVDLGEFMEIPSETFPDVTWADEPIEVELLIRKI